MTVATTTNKTIGTGNGVSTSFPFTFATLPSGDLVVSLFDTDGVEIPQVENTDYTVLGEGADDGGAVVFVAPPPDLYKVLIRRVIPVLQPTDLKNQGSYYPRTVERMSDRSTMIDQQQDERISAAITLPPQVSGVSTQLPSPVPNTLFGWDSAGTAISNFPLSDIATNIAYGDKSFQTFTGTGAQVNFTLTQDPGSLGNLDVSIEGVTQVNGVDFTYTATTLTFSSAPSNGDVILVRFDIAVPVGAASAGAVSISNTLANTAQQSLSEWLNGVQNSFHTDTMPRANVWRVNDRVQVGGFKDYGAAWNGGVGSTTGATPEALTLHNWAMRDTMMMADSTVGAITIMGHAQSSKGANWAGSPGNTPSSIGLAGFAINDATNGQGWGVYGEAVRFPGANFTVGSEFAVANLGSVTTPTPSNLKLGGATGGIAAWLQAGAGLDAVGYAGAYGAAANPAAAIAVVSSYADNSIKFRKGFVFSDGALDQTTGSTGANGVAMELPRGAEVRWLFNDGSDHVGGSIRSSNATAANQTRIDFSDFGLRFLGVSGAGAERTAFQVVPNPNAVNYLSVYPQAAGQMPQIGAEGSDANIDFLVAPKGSGLFATSYGATNAVNTANFVAQRTIAMKFNGVTLFLPAMTTGW